MVVSITSVSQEQLKNEKGKIMPLSQEFIVNRTRCTVSVQLQIAPTWVWSGKTVAEWETDLVNCNTRLEAMFKAEAKMKARRGKVEAAMEDLHEVTVVYLTLLKTLQRKDAAHLELLGPLSASGGSRNGILDEAADLQSAWEEIDAEWEPRPGEMLADFILQIEDCAKAKTDFTKATTAWRNRASELRVFLEEVNGDCVAWYAAATVVFPEDTAQGGVIRGLVPTTYVPSSQPAPTEMAA